ncbi:MAG: GTPase Era, partial [Alphaproteobacteria bacterium]|nr:GTPase Era [Alphaproteobacteria bacterium]
MEKAELQTRAGFVSLIGAPNAGKSSIMNHFVGSKVSIVSHKAQTTRAVIKGIGIYNQTQIVFLDTPGIFNPKRRLDRAMIFAAWEGMRDADVTVLVVDAKRGFDNESKAIVQKLKDEKVKALLVLNKTDLVKKDKLLILSAEINEAYDFEQTFFVSVQTEDGLQDFYAYLAEKLPVSPWFYPEEQMSDMPLKLLAAEVVREKLFLYLKDELPYALTAEPELWERRDDGSVRAEIT